MTAPVSDLEAEAFAALAALDRRTVAEILELWALLDLSDLQGSFEDAVLPDASGLLVEAQAAGAQIGADYVGAEADALGAGRGARVSPWGFAGVASDGRSLTSLLAQPFVQTLTALSAGAPPDLALQAGAYSLDRVVTTQIQDAGRTAEAVGIAATPDIKGYLRSVEPGACPRCIILAGRFYRFNDGFDRHPSCRCSHRPVTRDSQPQSDREIFDAMTTAEQDRTFGAKDAEAIRLGAEPNLVVNARRGMTTAANGQVAPDGNGGWIPASRQVRTNLERLVTTEGTSRRGLAYQRMNEGVPRNKRRKPVRLMPESLLLLAKDRDDAVRLLRLHGYIL